MEDSYHIENEKNKTAERKHLKESGRPWRKYLVAAAVLFGISLTFTGCGSDEVISVSDLGKSSETTTAASGEMADSPEDENSTGGSAEDPGSEENGTGGSATDTAGLVGTWDESAHTYTNTALGLELTLAQGWSADTSAEGGIVLSYGQDGLSANVEFVFDLAGAYADTDTAWEAYYEYMNLEEDDLLLLAASAYAAYDTASIGGEEFTTLTMAFQSDGNELYRYAAIGETEGCVAVIMVNIEAELTSFASEEDAQDAVVEMVETLQVW